jgi:adenylate cyclase class IV
LNIIHFEDLKTIKIETNSEILEYKFNKLTREQQTKIIFDNNLQDFSSSTIAIKLRKLSYVSVSEKTIKEILSEYK